MPSVSKTCRAGNDIVVVSICPPLLRLCRNFRIRKIVGAIHFYEGFVIALFAEVVEVWDLEFEFGEEEVRVVFGDGSEGAVFYWLQLLLAVFE